MPEWEVRDAVFDAATDVVVKAVSYEGEDSLPWLLAFSSEEKFLNYVFTACKWRALDHAKKYHRRRESRASLGVEIVANPPASPEEATLEKELYALLNNEEPGLTDTERLSIQRRLEGYNLAEIAEQLGVSTTTAQRLVKSAQMKLAEFLGKQ
jgi:RNA polymerase sigma factor (sigma-70 family)